jgi:hypothetical protein
VLYHECKIKQNESVIFVKINKMKRFLIFLVLIAISSSKAIAQGCSQCKLMAEQGVGVDDTTFASNINSGILYLMAFPYIILLILFRKQITRFLKSFFAQAKSPQ